MRKVVGKFALIVVFISQSCSVGENDLSAKFSPDKTAVLVMEGNTAIQYKFDDPKISPDKKWVIHQTDRFNHGLHIVALAIETTANRPWALIELPAGQVNCSAGISEVAWSPDSGYAAVRYTIGSPCSAPISVLKDDTLMVNVGSKSSEYLSRIVREALEVKYPLEDPAYHESMKGSPVVSFHFSWKSYAPAFLTFTWSYEHSNNNHTYPGIYEPVAQRISVVFSEPRLGR